jgi:streptogramin lyase
LWTRRHLDILLSLLRAFTALLLLLFGVASAAGISAQETALNPNGLAYELNPDSQGILWVSDYTAGEIWSFDATSGAHTAYQVGGGPHDAHSDGAGSVWWADFDRNQLGRLSTSTREATVWVIPGDLGLYSTAIDSSGDVWASHYYAPLIYKLDPDTNQLCTFEVPDLGVAEYLYINGEQLWFGDTANARLVRLQDGAFHWWNLPVDSYPRDLELDASGGLWWTDAGKGHLGRLDSGAATITTFTPPTGGTPQMLALSGGKVWTAQQVPGQVLVLDPAAAASQTTVVTTGSQQAAQACSELLPLAPTAVTISSGPASWTGQTYPTALDKAGWKIYDMPETSAPWGIVAAEKIWLVDQGRQVLARLDPSASPSTQIYLPLARKG